MFKVFVSHSSIDKALVDALHELITSAFIDDVDDLRDDADRLESRIARLEATRADAARRPRTP
jgi:hypothetical protein